MNNEITVRLKCRIEHICDILESKNFQFVEKYLLDDTYYILKTLKLKNMSEREILSNAIILRHIVGHDPEYVENKLTYKIKEIDKIGNIIRQNKIDCKILNLDDGKKFLEAIGYKELMNIKEEDTIYIKDEFQINIKNVLNGDNLIEIEENEKFNTLDKIKRKLEELDLPVYTNDYFVKKAEIELKKIL